MNKLQRDIEWSMTPFSREQWTERRKEGAMRFILTSGFTWWFAFTMGCGAWISILLFGDPLSHKHLITLIIAVIAGLAFGATYWFQCEKLLREDSQQLDEAGSSEST